MTTVTGVRHRSTCINSVKLTLCVVRSPEADPVDGHEGSLELPAVCPDNEALWISKRKYINLQRWFAAWEY